MHWSVGKGLSCVRGCSRKENRVNLPRVRENRKALRICLPLVISCVRRMVEATATPVWSGPAPFFGGIG